VRLKTLAIDGFRGFPRPVVLDLDAEAVIVAGVNGSGKTSFFDAILWVLSGSVGRLNSDPSAVVSEYSPSGEARVEVVLSSGASSVTVARRYDGAMHLTVRPGDSETVTGAAAEAALIDLLWPDAKAATDQLTALSRSLTRATYLQQDSVRELRLSRVS
jgi:DNA repair exonuclease SbcCD ATPase subunit